MENASQSAYVKQKRKQFDLIQVDLSEKVGADFALRVN